MASLILDWGWRGRRERTFAWCLMKGLIWFDDEGNIPGEARVNSRPCMNTRCRDYHSGTAMIASHAPDPVLIQEKSCLMLEEGGLRNILMCQMKSCSEQGWKITPTEEGAMNSNPSSLPLTRHQSKDQWLGEENRSLPAVNGQKANPICHWQRSKKTPCTLGPT